MNQGTGIRYPQGLAASFNTPPSGYTYKFNPNTGINDLVPTFTDINTGGQSYNINYNSQNGIQGVTEAGKAVGPRAGMTPNTGTKEPGFFDINDKGVSKFGSVLGNVGTAVSIGSGLAGIYYAKKQADLNKERAKMEKDAYNRGVQREAEAEKRMQQFAKNAGNGAFYA